MGIKQLPSGRFRLQIRRARLKIDETFNTREEAQRAMERLMGGAAGGAAFKPRGLTLDDAWAMYSESRQHLEKTPNTRRGEITHIKPVLRALGTRPLKSLASEDVDDFITQLTKEGKAPDTIRNAVSALSAVLGFAVKKKIVTSNVTIGVKRPAVEHVVRRMPAGHQGALMKVLTHPKYRFRAAARLALLVRETGARPGEWAKARWEDVDLRNHKVVFSETKYKRMPRTVPLTTAAMALLDAQMEDLFVTNAATMGDSEWVFPVISREREIVQLQYTGTMRDMKKLGLIPKSLRVHNGRHEFISTLVESSDLDDSRIMSLVGHHSPASMQIYTHARNVRFLPQLEAIEAVRRPDRAREIADANDLPVEVVNRYLAKLRRDEAAGAVEPLRDELLYEPEQLKKIAQAAKLMGTTYAERMATMLKLRRTKGRAAAPAAVVANPDGTLEVKGAKTKSEPKAVKAPAKKGGKAAAKKAAGAKAGAVGGGGTATRRRQRRG